MNFADLKNKQETIKPIPAQFKRLRSIRADVRALLPYAVDNKTVSRLREVLQILNTIDSDDFIMERKNERVQEL